MGAAGLHDTKARSLAEASHDLAIAERAVRCVPTFCSRRLAYMILICIITVIMYQATTIGLEPDSREGGSMTDTGPAFVDGDALSPVLPGAASLVVALVGLMLAYMLGLNVTPVLNGLWIDRLHLAPSETGLIISAQFVAMAIATILAGRFAARLRLRRSAIVAALWTMSCYLASGFATQSAMLMLCFGLSGVGIGFQMGAMAALLSHRADSDRIYAIAVVIGSSLVAALTIAFASTVPHLTIPQFFAVLALIPLVQLALAFVLPPQLQSGQPSASLSTRSCGAVPPVVVAMIFMQIGGMAVWAFTERVGHRLGLPTTTIGTVLAATAVTAIIGAACAARAARLQRRTALALVGLAGFGLSNLSIILAQSPTVYAAALLMQAFALTFTLPFLTAIALEEQDGGRTAAYAHGWSMLLGAASPYAAGWLIEEHGFAAIAFYSGVALLLSILPLLIRHRPGSLAHDAQPQYANNT